MPIYAYRCESCGHAQDVLQKMSDPVLTQCPSCGAQAYKKQVTAAGFQLKGTGWYVTDFRGGKSTTEPAADAKATGSAPAEGSAKTSDAKPATSGASESSSSTSDTAPAPPSAKPTSDTP
ncbi:MAG: FmdB family zinc ribbon protein [Pseudomonadota bacterium]